MLGMTDQLNGKLLSGLSIYAMLEKGSIHCQKVKHDYYWEPFPQTREVNLDAVEHSRGQRNLVIRRRFHYMPCSLVDSCI